MTSAITSAFVDIVAGIDVGGDKKGCHLVVLRNDELVVDKGQPEYLVQRCVELGVVAVGVDAPCRWGVSNGGARRAEKELAQERIFSFATPSRERALNNPAGFYRWMFNGERVYRALAATHPLLAETRYTSGKISFETFPHAITCAILGVSVASAKRKRQQRRHILEAAGVGTAQLGSIDAIDAALCALTAKCLLRGQAHSYGDVESGYIVVPATSSGALRPVGLRSA